MDKYLSIDIGGTFIKYNVMDAQGQILETSDIPTAIDTDTFKEQLVGVVEKHKKEVAGIGICIAGFIDPQSGTNTDFSVRPSFRAFNIKEELHRISGLPVMLENDSNCALIGEMEAGAGKRYSDVLLLTIGTGIGGALAIDKKLYRGSHFKAGEANFMRMYGREPEATAGLVRKVSEALHKQVDGYYIFEHLEDDRIREIYEDWLKRLAVAVGNVAVFFDPEAVLIGGGICEQKHFIEDLKKEVYDRFCHLEEYTQIKACEKGNQAGRIGAYVLLKQMLRKGV